jgi:Asp-tRNA(Asn)/Glu-tRNA(Gln) amidotransferase A subunit family amidase
VKSKLAFSPNFSLRQIAHFDDLFSQGLSRESWGPLHDLPITVKGRLRDGSIRTIAGAPSLSGHVPTADAVAGVARLQSAGAVLMGKTNTPLLRSPISAIIKRIIAAKSQRC